MAIEDKLQAISLWLEQAIRDLVAPVVSTVQDWLGRAQDTAEASYSLGVRLLEEGELAEARLRFRYVLWRKPRHAGAWMQMARCYFAMGEREEGWSALNRSLRLDESNEFALYLKATLEAGKRAEHYQPHTTPIEVVKLEFTERASVYDTVQLGGKGYVGHFEAEEVLRQTLQDLGKERQGLRLLDAGCGTGLCGPLLRPYANQLTGVDICEAMLQQARLKNWQQEDQPVYDHFVERDLRDYLLAESHEGYDAIIAANVLPVMGGMAALLDGAKRSLKSEGILLASAYRLQAGNGYRYIAEIRRFVHSVDYLKAQAKRSGMTLLAVYESPLYETEVRPAVMAVFQKP